MQKILIDKDILAFYAKHTYNFAMVFLLALYMTLFAIVCSMLAFTLSLLFSRFMGAPYVSTRKKDVEEILALIKPEADEVFIELGCGTGYITYVAAKKYGVSGRGIDINALLIYMASFRAWLTKMPNATYTTQNISTAKLCDAKYIYMFLLPKFISSIAPKLQKELQPETVVISHGFPIKQWETYLETTLKRKPFSTYIYRMS